MKLKLFKPLLGLASFALVVSMACSLATAATPTPIPPTEVIEKPTEAPEPTDAEKPTAAPDPTEAPAPVKEDTGAIKSLEDVKSATVFITVEGTWREPEGLDQNVGYIGSGFIIDPSGIAVTNNHVVTGAALVKVYVGDEQKARSAKVLGVSECSDLAIIDIEGDGFPYFEWSDKPVKVGTKVYAVGYPGGLYTLTDGIISATDVSGRTLWSSVDEVLQHTAKINPGNSGGPLVTEDGKVIGVNYASISSADRNLAISPDEALPIIQKLSTGKDVDSIGINGVTLVDYTTSDGSPIYGIWVRSVKPGSPADKARIEPGDILYSLSDQVLATDGTLGDYCDILRSHDIGDTVDMEVVRFDTLELLEGQLNGRELEVTASFGGGNTSGGDTGDNTGSDYDPAAGEYTNYVTVQDDTGTIEMSIPAAWSDIEGTTWSATWGQYKFNAPAITASADLSAYYNGEYIESTVFFAASDELGQIGGFIQLLDGLRGWHEDDCKLKGTYDYGKGDWYDPYYEGKFDHWTKCGGTDTEVLVLAARPKENKTAFLIIVEVYLVKAGDVEALIEILNSFQVIDDF
ncbi:MAG: trypsin-like peptidase domain-containing protein [Chloroflexota bacterium]